MNSDYIFHEFHGVYFKVMEKIVNLAQHKSVSLTEVENLATDIAYAESPWILMRNIKRGQYEPILDGEFKTIIHNNVKAPLTILEKRWLKAILADKRVKLFGIDADAFEGVDPLFKDTDVYCCGQYGGGDEYEDAEYINKFQIILKALHSKHYLYINYISAHQKNIEGKIKPIELQYSIKEDKFRLFAVYNDKLFSFNLSRIKSCAIGDKILENSSPPHLSETYVDVHIINDKHTLERFLLSFSNYRRSTRKISENEFKIRVIFPKQDINEVLVNILSFAPMAEILAPSEMLELCRQKIKRQKELFGLDSKNLEQ